MEGQTPKHKFRGLPNGEWCVPCFLLCLWCLVERSQEEKGKGQNIPIHILSHEKAAICQMPLHINFASLKAVMVQDKTIQYWSHYGWHIKLPNWFISPSFFFTHISQQKLRLMLTGLPGRKWLCLGVDYKQRTANVLSEMKRGRSRTVAEIIHGLCWN